MEEILLKMNNYLLAELQAKQAKIEQMEKTIEHEKEQDQKVAKIIFGMKHAFDEMLKEQLELLEKAALLSPEAKQLVQPMIDKIRSSD